MTDADCTRTARRAEARGATPTGFGPARPSAWRPRQQPRLRCAVAAVPWRGRRTTPASGGVGRERGVGLVEVLVSVLVVAVGMLGAAALQTSALRNNQGSYERTQISILTQGMFDAMRANPAGVTGNSYNTGGWVCSAPVAGGLAASDIGRWIGTVQQQVHAGACGRIQCLAGACTVGVRWDDSRATGGLDGQIVQMQAQL